MRRAAVVISLSSSGEWTAARSVMGMSKPRSMHGGRTLEQADSGPRHPHKDQHGRRDGDGESLGAAEGQRFGDQLADGDVEVGDEGKADRHGSDGSRMCVNLCMGRRLRQQVDPAEDDVGGQRLADPADRQRARGDAQLNGGQEVLELVLKAANGARAGNLGGEKLLDARVAGADHGELGGHKESVGQNQHGDGDNLEKR